MDYEVSSFMSNFCQPKGKEKFWLSNAEKKLYESRIVASNALVAYDEWVIFDAKTSTLLGETEGSYRTIILTLSSGEYIRSTFIGKRLSATMS